MNLQESIRKILREETINLTTILRRVSLDDLEREFEESLDMASDNLFYHSWKNIKKKGYLLWVSHFILVRPLKE